MKVGGYQIIDLKSKPLKFNVGMVYEGIYDLIEGTRKPILISGLVMDTSEDDETFIQEIHDCFSVPIINGTTYSLPIIDMSLGKLILTISDNDVVTLTAELA